jgi:hypothetical protein
MTASTAKHRTVIEHRTSPLLARWHVRASRVKCELPGGMSIVVAGNSLGMDEVIEHLGTAQKEARKARDQNLDVKTWSAVMRDRAKKGSIWWPCQFKFD